jgi:DNA-binding winged helix-turn-helix (wHTH) protein
VWVSRLRRKLEDDPAAPRLIRTFPGIGYMFDPEAVGGSPDNDDSSPREAETATA